jgi:hypothetical protein
LDLAVVWQKIASSLQLAIFCQINAAQYKTHELLRGHVHWFARGKKCHWQATGKPLACHWQKLPELAKKIM